MLPFDRLEAGRAGYRLAPAVHEVTEAFPKREWYGLAAQARRAACSVPLNLSEGSAKRGVREFRRYVDIAIGSLAELVIILRLARDRGMISENDSKHLATLCDDASKLTHRLAQALDRRRARSSQPSNRLTV